MTSRSYIYFVFILMFTGHTMYAQSDDFQLRSGIEVKKDFRKGFDLSVDYQYRRNQNLSMFQSSYFSISPSYKINDFLSASFELRYGTSKVWDRFRYAYYLSAKNNFNKIQLSLRAGYLSENYLQEVSDIDQFISTNNIRIRLQAERKLVKHVKATVSFEPIFRLENGMSFSRMRNIVDVQWEHVKNQSISIGYLHMPSFSSALYLSSNHILQVKYAIMIPKSKK